MDDPFDNHLDDPAHDCEECDPNPEHGSNTDDEMDAADVDD